MAYVIDCVNEDHVCANSENTSQFMGSDKRSPSHTSDPDHIAYVIEDQFSENNTVYTKITDEDGYTLAMVSTFNAYITPCGDNANVTIGAEEDNNHGTVNENTITTSDNGIDTDDYTLARVCVQRADTGKTNCCKRKTCKIISLTVITVVVIALAVSLGVILTSKDQSVDGVWSVWGSWSECSASCSTEQISRNRSCSNLKPSNGSNHCLGDSTEYKLCDRSSCSATILTTRNCKDLMDKGDATTGFKRILPDGINPVSVLCIMEIEGGGWTVFQQRKSATDFYKNWQEYRNGFGDDTNFWLGLENIHRLTAQGNYELRIDMIRTNNQSAAAKYQNFSVGNETMLYKLSIGNYSFDPTLNDPGDSVLNHNGMKFTTYDKDNDAYSGNCAVNFKGGYWYHIGCHHNNLNGLYGSTAYGQGINWASWTGYVESLKYTRMMIRPN